MDTNPWLRLPTEPPYVLPEDREAVEHFNCASRRNPDHFLHVDELLPEPFIGAKDAPVLLLSNNPGLSANGQDNARQSPIFHEWVRHNLNREPLAYPFYYLDPDYRRNGGSDWWDRKLKHLLPLGRQVVASSILNVVYFPYPSRRFGHKRLYLPSLAQKYSFGLVRDAVNRKAIVILLRSGKGNQKAWLKAVPELNGYDQFYLGSNPQQPCVSPGNCPSFFDKVVDAIQTFMHDKQGSEVRQ